MNKIIMAAFFALIFIIPLTSTVALANNSPSNISEEQMLTINVNTAKAEELVLLKGVGQVKAQAIVSYRETYGEFSSLDELLNVKGIGEKVLKDNIKKLSI
jgi:competence protein ComEA